MSMLAEAPPRYLSVQGRGTITLPADIRRRYQLDEPGAQIQITEREGGVIELRPALPMLVSQQWFWTKSWQNAEREVDEYVGEGAIKVYDDAAAMFSYLDELP